MKKQLYSASEAAAALGISLDTLRRWDKAGRIKVEPGREQPPRRHGERDRPPAGRRPGGTDQRAQPVPRRPSRT